ncbi:MAG: Gfo/Idh/MocA family oxidoreductase [Bdellovibrionaceae bacterium]|jgi:predicted dehydrogenase|nr:Gfo/Idh/MocA family oxidoreductase [Pseudobdellovibrionaceae bacterium]
MNKKIRAAVIGVGYLGKFHAEKYFKIDNSELVAVCDLNREQGEEIAKKFEAKYIANYEELVGLVDAVTIASTTSSHYKIAKFFLENNVHVHVEKPMTTTSQQGQELCEIAESNKLKLQVGHVERFNPALVKAREKLAKPLFIECHRLAPFNSRGADVNVILDLMIHDLDVVLSLVKSPIKEVKATGTHVLMSTLDIANARVEFESGAVANITASRVSQTAQRKFRVFQEDQYLSIDFGSGQVQLYTKEGELKDESKLPIKKEEWNLEKSDALLAETEAFLDAIINDKPCLVSGEDGVRALQLAEQIIQQI